MTENVKTLSFVAVAFVAALVAWASRPHVQEATPDDVRGKLLYPDLKDPLAVTSLEITDFDEATATLRPFKVAQIDVKGKRVWRIPSHDNYPADAKEQVASAAAGLMGLTILEQKSDDQGDQALYGVVDPDEKTLTVGATGVGKRVVMRDKDDKELLALIIGKTVPDHPDLCYVRKVGQAPIYVVAAKTDKLTTKFDNWIEHNLLNINSFDIKQLWIQDYSVDKFQGALMQRGEMVIDYNDADKSKWKLTEDQKFVSDEHNPRGGEIVPVKLADDQELNAAKLDTLKTALDDLKIIDVSPKPAGLSADLKAEADFVNNREAVESLGDCGFYVAKLGNQVELFSNDGETRILTNDGVQYVLRFGGIHSKGDESKKDEKDKDAKDADGKNAEKKSDGPKLNRYLFVAAEFNPDIIPKPQLEPLPEAKPSEEGKDAAAKPAEETKPEGQVAGKKADENKAGETKATDEKKPEGQADENKADERKAADAKATDEKKPEGQADEKKADEHKAADAKATDEKKPEDAERQRVEKENKRKQDEYEQKIADGKKKVNDLNARFADWYYVISDDVYHKIHLGRDELIKKKEPPKEAKDAAKSGEQPAHDHAEHGDADHSDAGVPNAATPSPDELEPPKDAGPAEK